MVCKLRRSLQMLPSAAFHPVWRVREGLGSKNGASSLTRRHVASKQTCFDMNGEFLSAGVKNDLVT